MHGDVGPSAGLSTARRMRLLTALPGDLVQALATMTDKQGTRLTVPGLEKILFERKVLDTEERQLVQSLQAHFAQADWNTVIPGLDPGTPVKVFKNDLTGDKVLCEYLYAPSVSISGLRSGYVGPRSKSFLLPHSAIAAMDIRTITDVDAPEIVCKIREVWVRAELHKGRRLPDISNAAEKVKAQMQKESH